VRDGKVYTAGADSKISVYGFNGRKLAPETQVDAPGDVWCMEIVGPFLFAGCKTREGGLIQAWNMDDGAQYKLQVSDGMPSHMTNVFALAVNYSSGILFSGGGLLEVGAHSDPVIRVWSLDGGAFKCVHEMKGHNGGIMSLQFVLGEKFLVSGSYDGTIGVWNASNGAMVSAIQQAHQHPLFSMTSCALPNLGEFLFTAGQGQMVNVYQVLPTGEQQVSLAQVKEHDVGTRGGSSVMSTGVVANKQGIPHLAVGFSDGHLKMYTLPDLKNAGFWKPHNGEVFSISVWHEQNMFAVGSFDKSFSCFYYQ
jgi:WD40 repeat protein